MPNSISITITTGERPEKAEFERVAMRVEDVVLFINRDTNTHWPVHLDGTLFSDNPIGPGTNSSHCILPEDVNRGDEFHYKCKFHEDEDGIIDVLSE
jgi:hypothetical protein